MSEITKYSASSLDERMRYAQTIASAGALIPTGLHEQGHPSPGKVLLVMETGSMLGIHPVAALQGVHVIEGKATISPALMSAVVRRAGHQLRVETTGSVSDGTFSATATLVRHDDPAHPFVVTWNRERAERAGLIRKGPWEKYFEAMCKARAISEVCREGATDALMGVGYVPEELGAEVNESGEIVVESEPQRFDPPAPARESGVDESKSVRTPVADPQPPAQSATIVVDSKRQPSRDWRAEADAAPTADDVLVIFNACRDAGELDIVTEHEGQEIQLRLYLRKLGERMRAAEEAARVKSDDAPLALDETIDERTGEVVEHERHDSGGSY